MNPSKGALRMKWFGHVLRRVDILELQEDLRGGRYLRALILSWPLFSYPGGAQG